MVLRHHHSDKSQLGIEPVVHSTHHKSHVDKTMGIVSTAIIPHNNDINAGGQTRLVSLTRVGKMMKADRDTYRQVYQDDASYHYPKIPENLLRKKGESYFKNLEIVGSKDTKKGKPKFNLQAWFSDTDIPNLEKLACEVELKTGAHGIIRYQMDNAGPHADAKLNVFLQEEFGK